MSNVGQSAEVNEFLSQLNNCGKDGVFVIATTRGYLTSDISAIVNEAARIAFRQKVEISMQIFKEVLKMRMSSLSKEAIEEYACARSLRIRIRLISRMPN